MDTVALPFLFVVLLVMPGLGIYSWYYLGKSKPRLPKKRGYRLAISAQVWLFVMTLAAAAAHKITLLPPRHPSARAWILGAVFLCVMLARVRLQWGRVEEPAKKRLRVLLPESLGEFWYWLPVAVLAGVGEECAYRGVAYALFN